MATVTRARPGTLVAIVVALAALAAPAALAACRAAAPPAKVVQLNRPGEPVDLDAAVVPDHVTVVDFWATWCAACPILERRLADEVGGDPRIVIRKIDVGDGQTPVARQHRVGGLPHVRVFDRRRRLRYVLVGADAMTAGEVARQLADEP